MNNPSNPQPGIEMKYRVLLSFCQNCWCFLGQAAESERGSPLDINLPPVGEGDDLGGADKGEVQGVEEEDHVLALVVA